jgi:hypothetical protein
MLGPSPSLCGWCPCDSKASCSHLLLHRGKRAHTPVYPSALPLLLGISEVSTRKVTLAAEPQVSLQLRVAVVQGTHLEITPS